MTLGRIFFSVAIVLLFACYVDAHAWMTNPAPRGQYTSPPKQSHLEYAPIAGNTPDTQEFVCRNDPVMPRASWTTLTAGTSQSITIDYNAIHPGDCFVYLTYDGDKPENEMKWFKIWEQHECYKKTKYEVPIPSYLPTGEHVIFRWEWYALHAFPTVEYYAQCVDAVLRGSSTGALPQPQVNIPGHLPKLVGGFLSGNNNYWWPYDNQPMFFTGPAVASLNGQPETPSTPAPTPKPTTRPTTPPTPTPTTKPTTRPTTAPTTRPTTAPTTRPTTAPTTAPTTRPTTAPTTRPDANNIQVGLNGGSNEWWLGVIVAGGAETTVKVELKDSGSFNSWTALADQYYYYEFEGFVVAPISLRLTSSTGKQVVLDNVFDSFSTGGKTIDTGKTYSSNPTTPTTPPTQTPTTPPTETPTTKPTPTPTTKPTTTPTTKPTTAPTTTPTSAPTTRPTTPPSSGTVKLEVNSGSSIWWFACSVAGSHASEISKMEVKDSRRFSSFYDMQNEWGNVYVFYPQETSLVLPLTVKAYLPSGSSVTFTVDSISAPIIDSGSKFQ